MKKWFFAILLSTILIVQANPIVKGKWTGYIVQDYQDKQNAQYFPCTLTIEDITDNGNVAATLEISYNYNGKIYSSKAKCSGKADDKNYTIQLVAENYIFYDVLPEQAKWCLGNFNAGFYRSTSSKKLIIQGSYNTYCDEKSNLIVLIKQ
ncbi:MAG: hypothetical protein H6553_01245 [Chitinophagales bacterium]|nr:hypothetical protein [Chitinophagales bacterium]